MMHILAVLAAVGVIWCWPQGLPRRYSWSHERASVGAALGDRRQAEPSSARALECTTTAPAGPHGRRRRAATPRAGDRRRAGSSRQPGTGAVRPPDVAVAMDLLALVAASGRGVLEAMDRVATVSPDHVRADLATVVAAEGWGLPPREAWRLVGPVWSPAATALALASTAGVAPSGILVRGAADIRDAQAEALDLAAAHLGVRLVLPLGLAFLPAFVLLTVVPLVVALASQLLR